MHSPRRESAEDEGHFIVCPHVKGKSSFNDALTRFSEPENWTCDCRTCLDRENLWICLECGHCGCGKENSRHSETHFRRAGHELVIELTSGAIHCYVCNEYVIGNPEIAKLQAALEQAKSLGVHDEEGPVEDDRWKDALIAGEARIKERQEDENDSAVTFYRLNLLRKTFGSWRNQSDLTEMMKGHVPLPTGRTGLRNLGFTCYINSVCQALLRTSRFRNFFLNLVRKPNEDSVDGTTLAIPTLMRQTTQKCLSRVQSNANKFRDRSIVSLTEEMHSLARCLFSRTHPCGSISPCGLVFAIWKVIPRLRGYHQQDAQEFLVLLLEALEDELKRLADSTKASATVSPPPMKRRRIISHQIKSFVQDSFGGKLVHLKGCCTCGTEVLTHEDFMCLSLLIPLEQRPTTGRSLRRGTTVRYPDSIDLSELLGALTTQEKLEGDNAVECDSCGSPQPTMRRCLLSNVPDILVMHISRYSWIMHSSRKKINTEVTFPDVLDLSPWIREESAIRIKPNGGDAGMAATPLVRPSPAPTSPSNIYKLRCIVEHKGRGLDSGHYLCYTYSSRRDTWLCLNDARVSILSHRPSVQAYLLVYEKIIG